MKRPSEVFKNLMRAPVHLRWPLGMLLVVAGSFGFLPVLGFWMIPLGLLICFSGSARVRRGFNRMRRGLRDRLLPNRRSADDTRSQH